MTEIDFGKTPEERRKALRKQYPLTVYAEECWEIYDEVEARIIATFYNEENAVNYIEWQNEKDNEDD
jgi:hypothetical protein